MDGCIKMFNKSKLKSNQSHSIINGLKPHRQEGGVNHQHQYNFLNDKFLVIKQLSTLKATNPKENSSKFSI